MCPQHWISRKIQQSNVSARKVFNTSPGHISSQGNNHSYLERQSPTSCLTVDMVKLTLAVCLYVPRIVSESIFIDDRIH